MEQTKTIASDKLLAEQLENRDWDKFWVRLMARCFWILRNRYNVKWNNEKLKEFSRESLGEIIEKIFIEKTRKWNVDRYPDFEGFIVGVIDSHINNKLNKKGIEIGIGENEYILNENSDDLEDRALEKITVEELRNNIFDELEKNGADDYELLIFECLADGIEKPEDIRTELGLSESEFHNSWRRLKRKRKIIQQRMAAYGY